MKERTYLGDHVYVSFDGCEATLITINGGETTNTIILESEVLQKFLAFVSSLNKQEIGNSNDSI